jgi:hypothetical protein
MYDILILLARWWWWGRTSYHDADEEELVIMMPRAELILPLKCIEWCICDFRILLALWWWGIRGWYDAKANLMPYYNNIHQIKIRYGIMKHVKIKCIHINLQVCLSTFKNFCLCVYMKIKKEDLKIIVLKKYWLVYIYIYMYVCILKYIYINIYDYIV